MTTAGSDLNNPKHDVTLEELDGSNRTGFIVVGQNGKRNHEAIDVGHYPQQATKIASSRSKYSDREPPFDTYDQDDFSGGRGQLDYADDSTRFLESWRLNTQHEKQLFLGGQETYSDFQAGANGPQFDIHMPGDVTWLSIRSDHQYVSKPFTVGSSGWTAGKIFVWIKKLGTPTGNLVVSLSSDSGGDPNTELATASLTPGNHERSDDISILAEFDISDQALTAATTYHVRIYDSTAEDATNVWQVAVDASSTGRKSSDDSTWSATTNGIYYMVRKTGEPLTGQFFTYKQAAYYVTKPDSGGNSELFLNGDRGVCDSNSGQLTKLIDATKSWTADEWIGDIVLLTKQSGAIPETKPWRTITDNDGTSLTVDSAWNKTHDTNTEYIIISSKWQRLADLGIYVSDVAVACGMIYFADGESGGVLRYEYYNSSGTWTTRNATENLRASKLLPQTLPGEGVVMWGIANTYYDQGSLVWRALCPEQWGDLYQLDGKLMDTDEPWDGVVTTNVTVDSTENGTQITLAGGFATGVAAAKTITATNITAGDSLGFLMKSDVATNAGDLKLVLADRVYGANDSEQLAKSVLFIREGQRRAAEYAYQQGQIARKDTPDNLLYYNKGGAPDSVVYYDNADTKYYDITNGIINDVQHSTIAILTTADYLYVGSTARFNLMDMRFEGLNATGSTLTAGIWDGDNWAAQTITDNTASGGATFGQNGTITWTMTPKWSKGGWEGSQEFSNTLYWIRFDVSTNLDGGTIISNMELENSADLYNDIQETYRSLTRAIDGEADTADRFFRLTGDDYIYVGWDAIFNALYVDVSVVNSVTSTMKVEYHNGNDWVSVSGKADGTRPGSVTLAGDGDITWTMPGDWMQSTVNSVTKYWVRLNPSTDLTYGIAIARILVWSEEAYRSMPRAIDGDTTTGEVLNIDESGDAVIVGSSNPFNLVRFEMGTTKNLSNGNFGVDYLNGHIWTAIVATDISDGTISAADSLEQTGDISWPLPINWQKQTLNGISAYWVRLVSDSAFTADLDVNEISIRSSDDRELVAMTRAHDGDDASFHQALISNSAVDWIYVCGDEPFNMIQLDFGDVNGQAATPIVEYLKDAAFSATGITIDTDGTDNSGKTLGQDGTFILNVVPSDWNQLTINDVTGYWMRISANTGLDRISISQVKLRNSITTTLSIPALTAATWQWVKIALTTPGRTPHPNEAAVTSVRMKVDVDNGAQVINIRGGIYVLTDRLDYRQPEDGLAMNGMALYGEPQVEPHVVGQSLLFRISLTQTGYPMVTLPHKEIGTFASETNGQAITTSGNYIYINFGPRTFRITGRVIEDIGVTKGQGLPSNRQGDVSSMFGFADGIMQAINAGDSGYSSVMKREGGGWHEEYRGVKGDRISDIYFQVIPGNGPNKLWVASEEFLLSVPMPGSVDVPLQDTEYPFTHEAYAVTSWLHAGYIDVNKTWTTLKAITENLSTDAITIWAEYQSNSGALEGTWTKIANEFNTSPFQEEKIASTYVRARKIRFRLRFETNDNDTSPVLVAWLVELLESLPVKFTFSFLIALEDFPMDAFGNTDYTTEALASYNQLRTWVNEPYILKLRSNSRIFDANATGREVKLEPFGLTPFRLQVQDTSGDRTHERLVARVHLIETTS